jgi:CheY-like chemotaxis protein
MKILLIEDEDRSVRQATAAIDRACASKATVDVQQSRDDAETAVRQHDYDVIICDLRIPPNARSVAADESHGLSVHGLAREVCPGTPLIFLTAFPVSAATRRQLSLGEVDTLYGIRRQPLVQLVEKDDIHGLEQIHLGANGHWSCG